MHHDTDLIATIAVGLTVALAGGLIAARIGLPVIVGYLLAGVAVGPFTPGFVADGGVATQLAEIGVILLMFGVGIHFSVADLWAVRRIALPGAIVQVLAATGLGTVAAMAWGWRPGEGIVLGLALSVASTVVLLRALEERGLLGGTAGRTAVGWLVVEDLVMVIALVLLPALAGPLGGRPAEGDEHLVVTLAITLGKVAAFVAAMLIVGMRLIPPLLTWIERTASRELFLLATLACALGIAFGAAELFDVSFALGAFLAGVVVNESPVSHRAAEEALPLREAFAVLFFVSVGMLIDPGELVSRLDQLAVVVAVVIVGKAIAALAIVRVLRGDAHTALVVAAALAQIGEFSFILMEQGRALGLLPGEASGLILGAAVISITLNPLLFRAVPGLVAWRAGRTGIRGARIRTSE
jgi:CPA2 family monovalent cation:H+ antiporter-2